MKSSIKKYIENSIHKLLHFEAKDIADLLLDDFQKNYDAPAHSIQDLKNRRNTKVKGDIFEHFALIYFEKCLNYKVWLLQDVPTDILNTLNLTKRDMGIDLIALDTNQQYYSIQVKYRKKTAKKTGISWKQLSTFYALSDRTGPYHQHIVFTNANFVRHIGRKTKKDKSICIGSLRRINKENWCKMSKQEVQQEQEQKQEQHILSIQELREARLKHFN